MPIEWQEGRLCSREGKQKIWRKAGKKIDRQRGRLSDKQTFNKKSMACYKCHKMPAYQKSWEFMYIIHLFLPTWWLTQYWVSIYKQSHHKCIIDLETRHMSVIIWGIHIYPSIGSQHRQQPSAGIEMILLICCDLNVHPAGEIWSKWGQIRVDLPLYGLSTSSPPYLDHIWIFWPNINVDIWSRCVQISLIFGGWFQSKYQHWLDYYFLHLSDVNSMVYLT